MKHIERILNAKTIPGLKRALNDFWFEFMSRESDDILLLLQEELEKISIAVETLQLWCERMLDTGVINREQYESIKNA